MVSSVIREYDLILHPEYCNTAQGRDIIHCDPTNIFSRGSKPRAGKSSSTVDCSPSTPTSNARTHQKNEQVINLMLHPGSL